RGAARTEAEDVGGVRVRGAADAQDEERLLHSANPTASPPTTMCPLAPSTFMSFAFIALRERSWWYCTYASTNSGARARGHGKPPPPVARTRWQSRNDCCPVHAGAGLMRNARPPRAVNAPRVHSTLARGFTVSWKPGRSCGGVPVTGFSVGSG